MKVGLHKTNLSMKRKSRVTLKRRKGKNFRKQSRTRIVKRELLLLRAALTRCSECRTFVDAEGGVDLLHCCPKHFTKLAGIITRLTQAEKLNWFGNLFDMKEQSDVNSESGS